MGGTTGFLACWGLAGDLGAAFLGTGFAGVAFFGAGLVCFLAGAAAFWAGFGGTTGFLAGEEGEEIGFADFLEAGAALPGLEVVSFVAMGASLSVRMDISII